MMKKKISMLMCFLLLVCIMASPTAVAEIPAESREHVEELTVSSPIQPFYVASCPGGGKHQMTGRGVGWIYSGPVNVKIADGRYK